MIPKKSYSERVGEHGPGEPFSRGKFHPLDPPLIPMAPPSTPAAVPPPQSSGTSDRAKSCRWLPDHAPPTGLGRSYIGYKTTPSPPLRPYWKSLVSKYEHNPPRLLSSEKYLISLRKSLCSRREAASKEPVRETPVSQCLDSRFLGKGYPRRSFSLRRHGSPKKYFLLPFPF